MRKVEQALSAVAGVVSARANLSARRVATVHQATGVDSLDLVEALDRIGFKAAELVGGGDSEASAGAPIRLCSGASASPALRPPTSCCCRCRCGPGRAAI
jgi:copper chaperone CopZ